MKQFHPDELSLLAAIHAEPREDTPRLVYADWLQEHDQEEYAEFIRLQCEQASKGETWSPSDYSPREQLLLKQFGEHWRGDWLCRNEFIYRMGDLSFCLFHRGLPEVHLDFWNDRIRGDRSNVTDSKLGPHYQLFATFNFVQSNDQPGLAYGLLHPTLVRAHRIHIRALSPVGSAEVPLQSKYAASAADILRRRNPVRVSFGPLASDAGELIARELAPHVPTVVNLPSLG